MSYFEDQSISAENYLKNKIPRKRIRKLQTVPSTVLNVCTHLPAFNGDAAKVTQCTSPTDRNACETYQYCTWNNGVTMLGSAG